MAKPKLKTPILRQGENASAEIVGILGRIPDGRSSMENFTMFIDACNLVIDDLPGFLARQSLTPTEASMERWRAARLHTISPTCYELFVQAFQVLLQASTDEDGTPTYLDVVGPVYMELLSGSRWNKDQFYTPKTVAECMAMMTLHDADLEKEFHERCMAVIKDDPVLEALTLAVSLTGQACGDSKGLFLEKLWPLLRPRVKPFTINDPCCGSGVLLLAAAKHIPRWLIDIGFVEFYGMDIQQIAVQMARLNFKLYGLTQASLPAEEDSAPEIVTPVTSDYSVDKAPVIGQYSLFSESPNGEPERTDSVE